jgi:CRP/FNR family transcriptional regulator, cyclic AMP receptor protein
MSVDPAFLAKISLFAPLDDDERAVLAQAMVDRQVKPGEVLFRAGEPGDSMFIVVEGGIELSVKDKAGQKIVLHTPTAGEFFGELSPARRWLAHRDRNRRRGELALRPRSRGHPAAVQEASRSRPRHARRDGPDDAQGNALLQARVSRNVNEAAESKLSLLDRIADVIAAFSGSMAFLILNGVWFVVWIGWNVVPMPWFEPFDPFPFGLLTMIVSLEAIFLSCFVLISQDRQSAKDRVRSHRIRGQYQGRARGRAPPREDRPHPRGDARPIHADRESAGRRAAPQARHQRRNHEGRVEGTDDAALRRLTTCCQSTNSGNFERPPVPPNRFKQIKHFITPSATYIGVWLRLHGCP